MPKRKPPQPKRKPLEKATIKGQCEATSKTTGKRCRKAALKGTKRCSAHPLSPDTVGFGSPAQAREAGKLGGRPRRPRPPDLLRQLVEAHPDVLMVSHFRTLGYDVVITDDGTPGLVSREGGGAKLYGTSKDGYVNVSQHEDLGAQNQAARDLFDRVYGRPKQATEITGAGVVRVEHGIDLRNLSDAELAELELLRQRLDEIRARHTPAAGDVTGGDAT
jgi:hypothetical protein